MKYFVDGDQLVITKDDFVNLQESPAVFYPLDSEIAKTVLGAGNIRSLPIADLMRIRGLLETGSPTTTAPDRLPSTRYSDVCEHGIWIRDCWICRNGGK